MTLSTAIGKVGVSVKNMLKPDAIPTIFPTIAQKAPRPSAAFKKKERARVRKEIKSQFFHLSYVQLVSEMESEIESSSIDLVTADDTAETFEVCVMQHSIIESF